MKSTKRELVKGAHNESCFAVEAVAVGKERGDVSEVEAQEWLRRGRRGGALRTERRAHHWHVARALRCLLQRTHVQRAALVELYE